MEYSKKLLLVPEERRQAVDHLSELDEKMDKILKKKDLSEDEKAALYLQVLQKFISYQLPPKLEKEKVKEEVEKTDEVEKTEEKVENEEKGEDFEEDIVRIAPKKYKSHAKDIYHFVKSHISPRGELVFQKQIIPETHIVTLIDRFLRKKSKPVKGEIVFYNLLKELHLPKMYDVHEKLYEKKLYSTRHKIVKPKMYARKHVWVKY